MPEMITANRLDDGHVVYLDAEGGWATDIRRGLVLADAEARKAALAQGEAAARANVVVEPYAIELEMRAGHLAPRTLRERIRADGPTIAVPSAQG
jgi:hypothetical protein